MTQQAQPEATTRREVLERNHAEIVALLASGATQPEVAQQFGVARSTVLRFVRRNEQEIERARHRVDLATEDLFIAQKANRIATYDKMLADIDEWLDEYGLTERSVRYDKDGNEVGETIRFRRDVIEAKRGVLRDAAEELNQIERPPPANVNIIDKAILVRYIEGPS